MVCPAALVQLFQSVFIVYNYDRYDVMLCYVILHQYNFNRSADMWGLGCLIWETFNSSLPRTSSLKVIGKVGFGFSQLFLFTNYVFSRYEQILKAILTL